MVRGGHPDTDRAVQLVEHVRHVAAGRESQPAHSLHQAVDDGCLVGSSECCLDAFDVLVAHQDVLAAVQEGDVVLRVTVATGNAHLVLEGPPDDLELGAATRRGIAGLVLGSRIVGWLVHGSPCRRTEARLFGSVAGSGTLVKGSHGSTGR